MKILRHLSISAQGRFGSHPPSDPDQGIFEGFFHIAIYNIFPQFGSYPCHVKFWKSSGLESNFGSGLADSSRSLTKILHGISPVFATPMG